METPNEEKNNLAINPTMISSISLYQQLLDNMHTAVLLLDEDLRLQYMNAAAETVLEMSAKRFDGVEVEKLFLENGVIPEGLIKAAQTGQRFTKRKTRFRLPMPADITVDYTVTPVNERWLLMEIQPLDRSLKISKEEALISSQEVSRKLVRGLAHEIKNPLGGLRGSAQLLERELKDEHLKEYTDIIIREADRLRKLVDQMLGPNNQPTIESVNIHEILEHVRKLISAEGSSSFHIETHTDYDPSLPTITGDREQLIQACLNIARNALQALEDTEHPSLTFRTRIVRKHTISNVLYRHVVRIDIIDNGPGIPEDIAENLFFPMVSGKEGGTGLGLSIAQSIISQHHGLIKFENLDGETVFSLYLPLE